MYSVWQIKKKSIPDMLVLYIVELPELAVTW